jgi:hypothetical protein
MAVVSEAQGNGLENNPQIQGKAPFVNIAQIRFHLDIRLPDSSLSSLVSPDGTTYIRPPFL